MSRRRFLVTYDISDPKGLTKTFKTMQGFGDHLQYSVFICELNEREKIQMTSKLTDLVNNKEDQILIIDLGLSENDPNSYIHTIGRDYVVPSRVLVI